MNDIKVKNRRVNKKKALIMILLGITILGVINRTWAYVDEQIKIKAEQERLAEEKRKAEEEKKLYQWEEETLSYVALGEEMPDVEIIHGGNASGD